MSPNNFTWDDILKIEGTFADVTPVESPVRAERDMLEMILDVFLANSGLPCGRGATL